MIAITRTLHLERLRKPRQGLEGKPEPIGGERSQLEASVRVSIQAPEGFLDDLDFTSHLLLLLEVRQLQLVPQANLTNKWRQLPCHLHQNLHNLL